MALPHSDAFFIMAFPREMYRDFWEGHVRAFKFFGLCLVGSAMTTTGGHVQDPGFPGPQADLWLPATAQATTCSNITSAWSGGPTKGRGRRGGQFTRLNFFVPVPEVQDFDELNAYLLKRCQEDLARRCGQDLDQAQLLQEDRVASLDLPEVPSRPARRPRPSPQRVPGKIRHQRFTPCPSNTPTPSDNKGLCGLGKDLLRPSRPIA